jgi:hypothetical protein
VEPFLLILIGAAGIAGAFLAQREKRRARRRRWRAAAESCGLSDISESVGELMDPSTWTGPGIVARDGDLRVEFDDYPQGKRRVGTRVVVHVPNPLVRRVALRREGLASALQKGVLRKTEPETGDPRFDDDFFIEAVAADALALFDAETRDALCTLGGTVVDVAMGDDEFRFDLRDDAHLDWALEHALKAARRLAADTDVPTRLAVNAGRERVPAVRLRNLQVLVEQFPLHAALPGALKAAAGDPDPEIRLLAAPLLGEDGVAVWTGLVEDANTPDSAAARAVTALGDRLGVERAQALLERAVKASRFATAEACLEQLGRTDDPAALASLMKVIAGDEAGLATVAARAVRTLSVPAAEPTLIAALGRDLPELALAAAETLGRGGTVAAVLPLEEAAERGGRDVRGTARQAIAEIQSRVSGASPGQLSIADGATGALSMVEDERGKISLSRRGKD